MAPPTKTIGQHLTRVYDSASNVNVRSAQRSLSLAVRNGFDPEWYLQWKLLVLQGKQPILVPDKRCHMGHRVDVDDSAPAPTHEERAKALKELMDRGYGLPVQQLLLDAELRGQIATLQADLDLQAISGALTLEQRNGLLSVFGLAPGVSSTQGVIDVPSSEVESSSDPESSED